MAVDNFQSVCVGGGEAIMTGGGRGRGRAAHGKL